MTDDLEARLRSAMHSEAAATRHDADSLTTMRSRARAGRRRRHHLALLGVVLLVVALGAVPRLGRDDDQGVRTKGQPNSVTTTTTEAPTTTTSTTTTTIAGTGATTASPATPTSTETTTTLPLGDVAPGCINGWVTPEPGTDRRIEPLDAIRRGMGITGKFKVVEMRYFWGPEVPWMESPSLPTIEWWYVKAQLADDPTFQARWLVVRRAPGVDAEVIAAVAPFDTTGYRSPDWRDFIGDGEPHTVEGLPGKWVGSDVDFVKGEDDDKPGLPDENAHCLDGT